MRPSSFSVGPPVAYRLFSEKRNSELRFYIEIRPLLFSPAKLLKKYAQIVSRRLIYFFWGSLGGEGCRQKFRCAPALWD